ncbi:hypothetical protein GCM10027275_39550 [Rhabdobacter roseus]|uniref:Glycosyltransferase RgtA/B/C/D-like domain-containing protein n=1 Tax=Rhabdobacter roseus TaxID=1655419 RepID=A0A840TPH1_9BACT|nr:hypothetical protein [Rhabdobacter roseus]MBB5285661.1 hypothetical protein [Rhabdobacter roseus]
MNPLLARSAPLVWLWLVQSALVLALAGINPNHFTTIDSGYYLAAAQNLLDGRGYVVLEEGRLVWNGTFPLGYPAAIALVSLLTTLPVLWASKVLNLLASGYFLYFLGNTLGTRRALVTGSVLLLGPFLKLWAHTWSEPLFLVVLFVWVRYFFAENRRWPGTFLLGLALMLVRYVGVFIVPLAVGAALYWNWKEQFHRAGRAAALSLGWALSFGAYLGLNYLQSGFWYGGDRFTEPNPAGQVLILLGQGLLNELFLFRDTDFQQLDVLFLLGVLIQVLLGTWLYLKRKDLPRLQRPRSAPTTYAWLTAAGYLLFLLVLRLLSPFDAPGYRLLSPFTFLILWGVLYQLTESTSRLRSLRWLGLLIILASWLHLLPQTDLAAKLSGLWGA